MKKRFICFLLLIFILSISAFVACQDSHTHDYANDICVKCGEYRESVGLELELLADNSAYKVVGIGDCEDTRIFIPNTFNNKPVVEISSRAFRENEKITYAFIPENVSKIKSATFSHCFELTELEVDKDNKNYKSIDGNIYTADGKVLVQYATGKKDESFAIPSHVEQIGTSAFAGSERLIEIVMSDTLTELGDECFADCIMLSEISLPSNIDKIPYRAFFNCDMLVNIDIPQSVKSIGKYAFYSCEYLTNITVGENLNNVGLFAFEESFSIKFNEKDGLCYLGYDKNPYHALVRPNDKSVEHAVITDECAFMADGAFYSCSSLKTAVIGANIERISKDAFCRCSALETVTFSEKVKVIDNRAFYSCSVLKDLEFNEGLEVIGEYAFYCCDGIKDLVFPNSLKSLGEGSFFTCDGLKSVSFGTGIEHINLIVFYFDEALTKFTYRGTLEEWKKVKKEWYWAFNAVTDKVDCIDGTMQIEEQ